MVVRSVVLALFAAVLVACSNDPATSPGTTTFESPTTAAADRGGPTSVAPSASTVPSSSAGPSPSTTASPRELPQRCVARTEPMYPNPATEQWVPSPETDDVIDDFARLVLGWPDVQVADQQPDGPVTLMRITSRASPQAVELVVLHDAGGRPVSVCSARSVIDGEGTASVLIEGRRAISGFGVRVHPDDPVPAAIHELFPDVVSAQLLISHGPHVQQSAATDPEKVWDLELDHPTTEPGWQMAFWRDADGATLVVMDTDLPAGDFAAN